MGYSKIGVLKSNQKSKSSFGFTIFLLLVTQIGKIIGAYLSQNLGKNVKILCYITCQI